MRYFHSRYDVHSWGRTLRATHFVAEPSFLDDLHEVLREARSCNTPFLATGLQRSYGDSSLNANGGLIDMTGLDRLIDFDMDKGVLTAQAGTSLQKVIEFALPRGYFLPVTPGTSNVSLGGAVANDVHGKNHHSAGTFGRWVLELGLLRSDGTHHVLRPGTDSDLFSATLGGLGLTGVITHVTLQLRKISSAYMDVEQVKFNNIDGYFDLCAESENRFEYTVAWVDCLARGDSLGRGLLSRATHSTKGGLDAERGSFTPGMPFDAPAFTLNRYSIAAFNAIYFRKGAKAAGVSHQPYDRFFYPLDRIRNWNRLYGKNGMYQYQSVVPPGAAREATRAMLSRISESGQGSFLVVLKNFGSISSPGFMSFPMEGTTLALDFPNRGRKTHRLLSDLDEIVHSAGGRLYPAKDGRLSRRMLEAGYPALEEFRSHVDPGMESSFWQRIMEKS